VASSLGYRFSRCEPDQIMAGFLMEGEWWLWLVIDRWVASGSASEDARECLNPLRERDDIQPATAKGEQCIRKFESDDQNVNCSKKIETSQCAFVAFPSQYIESMWMGLWKTNIFTGD
jgi:hypothetical protein